MATYDVFLSYTGHDRSVIEHIADRLDHAGLESWLNVRAIAGGEPWMEAISSGMRASSACAVFIGPHGQGSWVSEEIRLALHRSAEDPTFRIIPVLLPGLPENFDPSTLPDLDFLRGRNWIDLRAGLGDGRAIQALIGAIKGQSVDRNATREQRATGGTSRMSASSGSFSPTLTPISYLSENIDIVQKHIRDFSFTPILGPGCSLVGRSEGSAWKSIGARMEGLLAQLQSEDIAARYLRALAAVSVYDVPLSHPGSDNEAPVLDDPLAGLQLALTRLGAQLGTAFASVMMESSTPLWDTVNYRLLIPRDHPHFLSLPDMALNACIAARLVKNLPQERDHTSGLEISGMYERLTELASELCDSNLADISAPDDDSGAIAVREAVLRDFEFCRRRHRIRQDDAHGGIEISVHQLEWIADALWHTFRYDQPAYPRADELAFQISLLSASVRGRRPELVLAAEVGRVLLSTSILASWYDTYGQNASPSMLEFYDAVARILSEQFSEFETSSRRATPEVGRQPVAFSTTFDLEMEAALHRLSDLVAFHVVIPVYAYATDDPQPELKWLLGTVRKRDEIEHPMWEWFSNDWTPHPRDVQGPILIKMHGSPLHTLPPPHELAADRDALYDYDRLEHALVLSESEHLQNIVWKDSLPSFFNMILLQRNRSLFFLGHSLQQWDTRLRMFSHVYRRDQTPCTSDRIAISRSHDAYRSAVLSAIGIHRWVGDLEEIPRIVDNVLA